MAKPRNRGDNGRLPCHPRNTIDIWSRTWRDESRGVSSRAGPHHSWPVEFPSPAASARPTSGTQYNGLVEYAATGDTTSRLHRFETADREMSITTGIRAGQYVAM